MELIEITSDTVGSVKSLPEGSQKPGGFSLAIGFFDGVHLGHADVVRRAVEHARERGQTPAVMTFDPHPRAVLGQGDQYKTVLTPLTDKLDRMEELGVETAFVIRFDPTFASVTAERFVRELLLPLGVRTAVVGFDFSFGFRGEGNADALRRFGGGDIGVEVALPVEAKGGKVSSTRIRDQLASGDCESVARLLGRPYSIHGTVVHGDARGRQIGFPTANLLPDEPYVLPKTGVYAVTVSVTAEDGETDRVYDGVLNMGHRPTFDKPGGELKLEANLFNFQGDLYGRRLELFFHAYLREERKFASVEELIAQIGNDAGRARTFLAERNRNP